MHIVFFSQYLNKKEIVIDISIFFSAHFLAYEGSIAFSTIYIFLNSTFYARYNTKNDSAIRDLFTEQKQFN